MNDFAPHGISGNLSHGYGRADRVGLCGAVRFLAWSLIISVENFKLMKDLLKITVSMRFLGSISDSLW
jgi:hypothetical protein